jgi:hypothetical protein
MQGGHRQTHWLNERDCRKGAFLNVVVKAVQVIDVRLAQIGIGHDRRAVLDEVADVTICVQWIVGVRILQVPGPVFAVVFP